MSEERCRRGGWGGGAGRGCMVILIRKGKEEVKNEMATCVVWKFFED